MNRDPEFKFVDTDTNTLVSKLVAEYEALTGMTVHPASPEKLFIQWIAGVLVQERALINYAANQNIPSRAENENLDALGELFYDTRRPTAQRAVCTERFYIQEPQNTSILVPLGTRVTDRGQSLIWETTRDAYIPIGETFTDVQLRCQTAGIEGNGFESGQLNCIVDLFDYYLKCENITVSDNGTDEATDDEYYGLLRASVDGYSCAGASGGYAYFAKQVSTEIADVVPNKPSAGCVNIYVLMNDGSLASDEIKNAVYAACNDAEVRPLTDFLTVADAETVEYDLDFTYFIQSDVKANAADIEERVNTAVQNYISWQSGKFGRDINPDKLREYLSEAGIKRIVLNSPEFTVLRNGKDNTVPQVAKISGVNITNGGFENE
ncbi:MAG: baseplate J/gp47 family protein [Clostridia bacterium]|nr:baseplate J/gp47 family protein [Clostridia bacterium]